MQLYHFLRSACAVHQFKQTFTFFKPQVCFNLGVFKSWQRSVSLRLFLSFFTLVAPISFFLIIFIKTSIQFNLSASLLDSCCCHLNMYVLYNVFVCYLSPPSHECLPTHLTHVTLQGRSGLCATSAPVNLCVVVCL